jgi:hypothetical protein
VIESATSETFAPHVGSAFVATTQEGDTLDLVLKSCDEDPASGPNPHGRVPFSLIFEDTDATGYAPQQTVTMWHEQLGEFPLFVVPLGAEGRTVAYQAIFS